MYCEHLPLIQGLPVHFLNDDFDGENWPYFNAVQHCWAPFKTYLQIPMVMKMFFMF